MNNQDFKILTVDDDEQLRSTISLFLENEGFQTVHAKNGRVALDYLLAISHDKLPDLILLDFMMPIMRGDEFCKSLIKYEHLRHIPVVMMTAGGNLVNLMDHVENEAHAYLSKPMELTSLLSMIEHFLRPHFEQTSSAV